MNITLAIISRKILSVFCLVAMTVVLNVRADERPRNLTAEDIEYVKNLIAAEIKAKEAEAKKNKIKEAKKEMDMLMRMESVKELVQEMIIKNRDDIEAKDSFNFNGYFRTGTNALISGGARNGGSCFALNYPKNDGIFYRLGNECRDFGELAFSKRLQINGLDLKAVWRTDIAGDSRSPTATEDFSRRIRELYVEMDNVLDFGKLWIGRRFYRSIGGIGDVHIADIFHVMSSGNGVGISDIEIDGLYGSDKLHMAAVLYGGDGIFTGEDATAEANFQNVLADIRYDMDLNNAGRVTFALQNVFINDAIDQAGLSDGRTLTVQWNKELFGKVDQKTVFQFGMGSMAENPGCSGTDGGCFNYAADSSDTGFRIFNNGTIDFNQRFKMNYVVMYEKSDAFHTLKSIGIRPHYSLSKYWSVLGELGYNEFQTVSNGVENDEQHLMKFAIALQATADSTNFWSRPSLRFYVSSFNWNAAAGLQSNLSVPGEDDETDAIVAGVQTEIWF